jgi:hypothetical protein
MATFSKRVTASGEVTHQAKCRRKGFPTLSKTFQNLSDAKKWARQIERSWDTGEGPASQPRTNTTLADVPADTAMRLHRTITAAGSNS